VVVFYLGMRAVGFPLGTLAFYVGVALSSGFSAMTTLWGTWVIVLLVGGMQWLVLMPMLVRRVLGTGGRVSRIER
jgi:hypothetical protein